MFNRLTVLPNCLLAALLSILTCGSLAHAQTTLFDFETGNQGWGSFGIITLDSGELPFSGASGQGRYHTGDFSDTTSPPPPGPGWGMIDVAPALNLSSYSGISVDARFISANPPAPEYSGGTALDIGLGFDTTGDIEYYAPAVTLTGDYQTYTVSFASMHLPVGINMSQAIIKLRFLNDATNKGYGEFDYDTVVGLPAPAGIVGDYNSNGIVDAADYVTWRDHLGQTFALSNRDPANSGAIGAADYASWRTHFGTHTGSGAGIVVGSVPEPVSCAMLLVTLPFAALVRHRRRNAC